MTPEIVHGKAVLELGCGNGLVSLAASRLGASSVLATDYRELPLNLVQSAASAAGLCVETAVFDVASPMPSPAIISTRSRARRIPPPLDPLPPHDVLLAADLGYSPALAWRLGERCRQAIERGSTVLVAESRQMPFCRSAFSEALSLGRADASRWRLRAVPWTWPDDDDAKDEGSATREEIAVGGDADAPMWILDSSEDM